MTKFYNGFNINVRVVAIRKKILIKSYVINQLIDFSNLSEDNRIALAYMKESVDKPDHTIRDIVKGSYDTEEEKKLFAKLSNLKEHFHNT